MTVSTFIATDATTQPTNTYFANNDSDWAVAQRLVDNFAPHAQPSPDMTVALDAGYLFNGTTLSAIAAQNTAALTAPTTNPRHDIVYIDAATATVGVATGTEAVSPVDPALPAGKLPVARITWAVGATSIANSMLTDLRALEFAGLAPQIQNQAFVYSNDSGTANAYAAIVSPTPAALVAGQRAAFKAANANTGASTFNWSGLGAKTIKKFGGSSDLASGDIVAGQIVDLEYDGTNWQMSSATAAVPFMDPTTTRGDLIVRGASTAQRLAVGTANQILTSNGTDPLWRSLSDEIDAAIGSTQGQILYRGAAAWQALAAGTSGQFLQTGGAAANPSWTNAGNVTGPTSSTANDIPKFADTTGKVLADGYTVGTAANNLVQLDGSAKLPAVDGSQLTHLPPGVPTGVILPYGAASAPSGWLLCFGQAVSRTTFATLFAAVGTTFGAGDGSTTFNVPDLRGRVPAGVDNMGGTAANRLTSGGSGIAPGLGNAGGAETVTLTTGTLPAHSHGISDPGHSHGVSDPGHSHGVSDPTHAHSFAGPSSTIGIVAACSGTTFYPSDSPVGNSTGAAGTGISIAGAGTGISIAGAGTGISTQNAGSGSAHQNTQPTIELNYIIKT